MARILIPTDFSSGSLRAAVYAVRLFGADGTRTDLAVDPDHPFGADFFGHLECR